MKCGENHSTHLCANCGGEHLSTFIKCPKNPNNPNLPQKLVPAPLPKSNPWNKNTNVDSKPTPETSKPEPKKTAHAKKVMPTSDQDELALVLGRMLLVINKTNATKQQKLEFLEHTEQLTKIYNQK
ncbi:hypothetical protein Trydic_g4630 [Trypoxylus dichotomus]